MRRTMTESVFMGVNVTARIRIVTPEPVAQVMAKVPSHRASRRPVRGARSSGASGRRWWRDSSDAASTRSPSAPWNDTAPGSRPASIGNISRDRCLDRSCTKRRADRAPRPGASAGLLAEPNRF